MSPFEPSSHCVPATSSVAAAWGLLQTEAPGVARADAGAMATGTDERRANAAPRLLSQWAGDVAVQPRVLLVCDAAELREPLSGQLRRDGMRVALAGTDDELFKRLGDHPSVVILDLDLWGDGLALLKRVRATSDAPVVLVSGLRIDVADGIVGLELGADDYVASPVDPREVSARIRSILRRRNTVSGSVRLRPRMRARFGVWELDCQTRQLHSDNGAMARLTKGEFALLLAFLDRPQRALSREYLLQASRFHEDMSDRSIDVQIARLRRKLVLGCGDDDVIATLRGIGYILRAEVEAS